MFDCTGKSSVRDPAAGGSVVASFSAPQRGPGLSPGNQRFSEYPYTQNNIKKYVFFSKFC